MLYRFSNWNLGNLDEFKVIFQHVYDFITYKQLFELYEYNILQNGIISGNNFGNQLLFGHIFFHDLHTFLFHFQWFNKLKTNAFVLDKI